MAKHVPGGFAQYVRGLAGLWSNDPRPDADLLGAFADHGDHCAFTALVGRHGPGVWATCWQVLGERENAEDAFQDTFIALARQAHSLRREPLGGWLAQVARRVALNVQVAGRRRAAARQRLCERAVPRPEEAPPEEEVLAAIHEELAGLPERFRVPLALYYLEGKTQQDVSRILGVPQQTVSDRLRKGLGAIRQRLAKRGMAVTATAVAALMAGVPVALAVPAGLVASAAAAALQAVTAGMAPPVAAPAGAGLTGLTKTVVVGLAVGVALLTGFWSRPSGGGEVSGSVSMGQTPLERAEVVLVPDRGASEQCKATRTVTDRDGRFRFAVGKGEGQVVPGSYRVLVLDRDAFSPTSGQASSVPADYRAPQQTPLRLAVSDASVVFDIPIDPVARTGPAGAGPASDDGAYRLRSMISFLHRGKPVWVEW